MIYDRTMADVTTAISIRAEKVQKGVSLTSEDIVALERGTLTYNTLNRIENKQEELKNLFFDMGYSVDDMSHSVWNNKDIFKQSDFDRILDNEEKLKNAFFVYKDTPKIANNNYRIYSTINEVEKILFDLDVMINDIKSHYAICGAIVCGERENA